MVRHDRGPTGAFGRVLVLLVAGLWCWAVYRLLLQPGRAGFMEGVVAAGGWGLSLLPVHCAPRGREGPRRAPDDDRPGDAGETVAEEPVAEEP
ncbi:hypothetical protein [Streptomyces sp. NPDC049555]|uniref:hypothetical protein n=1 Tax=Streptomyces sp. NPDC049555 TaxID=3154930 RepID=UPI00343128A6